VTTEPTDRGAVPLDPLTDPRLDPRVRAFLVRQLPVAAGDVADRQELLAESSSLAGVAALAAEAAFMELADDEAVAPSAGLRIATREIISSPDGNTIRLQVIRPDNDETLACVYYIHGGGMAALSCYYGAFRAWGKIIAARGVAVVMVDFRNAVAPSSIPEVAPYPAGLNDCVAGLRWVHAHAADLGVDPRRIVVSGESGGGNLTLATGMRLAREGDAGLVQGLYAFCPYIAGRWPDPRYPSSTEYFDLLSDVQSNRGAVGYGIEAFEAGDPLAWPGFATRGDVAGLPPTVISVNECDPLRDEGVAFYRLLLAAGVAARARVVLGTSHATEMYPTVCPEISYDAARDLAAFAIRREPGVSWPAR
jgi:acetyl esterase